MFIKTRESSDVVTSSLQHIDGGVTDIPPAQYGDDAPLRAAGCTE
ncbi:hypothetical protein ACZ87_03580 [Candidatus Erwinia dacicola]|uniref:Uncharacterized protein n=1 Tax=Candidatus Erwinia dacicola TaxID=252393 RepID=A0A328TGU7_9GAMM|nr:hypothetical protein ACZ87_03580 [Candidatus Erwinia dacicola]